MKTQILLCCLCVLTLGCVDKINLTTEDFTPQPVIVALLNSNGGLRVEISLTTNIDTESVNVVTNAKIRLWKKNAAGKDETITESFYYDETDKAYYAGDLIETEEGGVYWIELELSDGTKYISTKEKMPKTVEVSNIAYVKNQLRAIFQDEKNEANFYLAEFYINNIDPPFLIERLKVVSNDILFDGNEKAYIGEYITTGTSRYSVELDMKSLSNSSYLFYRNLLELEELNDGFVDEEGDPGWLFSKPPLNLYGNISEKESGKKVLGQFIVSSISYKNQVIE